jgi:AcrR family transcriptional regulator
MLSGNRLEDVAIDQIAKHAGISRGLLFHYFPSKRDFHLAVVEAAAQELLDRTAADHRRPVTDQLRASIEAFVGYLTDHRATYVSLVRGAAGGDTELQEIFDRTRTAFCERILQGLGAEAPVLPSVNAVVRGWVAFVDEVTIDWLSQPEPELSRSRLIDLLEKSLVALVTMAADHPA